MTPATSDQNPTRVTVDGPSLRRTMGRFATGVAVVTTGTESDPHGMTVNSLTSVSLDPPLVLVSLTKDSRTTQTVRNTATFAISILSVRQEQLALRFARRGEDHFEGLPLEYEHHDVPVVPGALAHVECVIESEVLAGDHVLYLGKVVRTCDRDGEPLAFYSGKFGEFAASGDAETHWFF